MTFFSRLMYRATCSYVQLVVLWSTFVLASSRRLVFDAAPRYSPTTSSQSAPHLARLLFAVASPRPQSFCTRIAALRPNAPGVVLAPSDPIVNSRLPLRRNNVVCMDASDKRPQELPSPKLLKAIAKCGNTATAADVAAAAGLDLAETRRQLLVLARLVGAELQVSEDGELLFVFDRPDALRRSLRMNSFRQRVNDAWGTVSPALYWLLRASFGIGLLTSIAVTSTALAALSSSDDDERGRTVSVGRLFGDTLDFLYYTSRPYGYYGYPYQSEEKGFLQSCFSFLFGDGDPNANLEQRIAVAAAARIRANGGAVTAEQLAPLLLPSISPEQADEEASRPGAPVNEDWMLPILLQFNGEPTVTEAGDIVYVFPELMATASESTGQIQGASGMDEEALYLREMPERRDEEELYLRELPERFSTAPKGKLALAGVLGVVNLVGVLTLGSVLDSVAGIPASSFGSKGPLIATLRRIYPALAAYASGWVVIPSVRAIRTRRRNRRIEARNAMREKWGRALPSISPSRSSNDGVALQQGSNSGGLRARLRRKLEAAKSLRPRLRRIKRDAKGQYSTSQDLVDVALDSKQELPGSGFDDFDARLAKAQAEIDVTTDSIEMN